MSGNIRVQYTGAGEEILLFLEILFDACRNRIMNCIVVVLHVSVLASVSGVVPSVEEVLFPACLLRFRIHHECVTQLSNQSQNVITFLPGGTNLSFQWLLEKSENLRLSGSLSPYHVGIKIWRLRCEEDKAGFER